MVVVFEASVVAEVAPFLVSALATSKVHLCSPFVVARLGQVGVIIDPKQEVADELSINSIIPRLEITALNSFFPCVANVTEFVRVVEVQACEFLEVCTLARIDGVFVWAWLVSVNVTAAAHGCGKVCHEVWFVVTVGIVNELLPMRAKLLSETVFTANP